VSQNPYESPPYHELPELTKEARNWAMFCHLAGLLGFPVPILGHILGPLIVWLLTRDEHPFIDDQGKEAVNFQISMAIWQLLLLCTVIGFFVLWIADIVLVIKAAIHAGDGEAFRYPMTIRFIK
jgi:uncharacterized protein